MSESAPPVEIPPFLIEITDYPAVVAALGEDVTLDFFCAMAAVDRIGAASDLLTLTRTLPQSRRVERTLWFIFFGVVVAMESFSEAAKRLNGYLHKEGIQMHPMALEAINNAAKVWGAGLPYDVRRKVAAHIDREEVRSGLASRAKEGRIVVGYRIGWEVFLGNSDLGIRGLLAPAQLESILSRATIDQHGLPNAILLSFGDVLTQRLGHPSKAWRTVAVEENEADPTAKKSTLLA